MMTISIHSTPSQRFSHLNNVCYFMQLFHTFHPVVFCFPDLLYSFKVGQPDLHAGFEPLIQPEFLQCHYNIYWLALSYLLVNSECS